MATIASSTILPMVGCLALACKCDQRASFGTQKTLIGPVFVGVFRVGPLGPFGVELGVLLLEGVGDVLQEDQAEDDVLVLGRVHVVAELVGGQPEFALEAQIRPIRAVCGHLFPPIFRMVSAISNRRRPRPASGTAHSIRANHASFQRRRKFTYNPRQPWGSVSAVTANPIPAHQATGI